MITVRLMGGLGNQMFQYACARRLSITLGVPLRLDIGWYDADDLMPHETYSLGCFRLCPDLHWIKGRTHWKRTGRVIEERSHSVDSRVLSGSTRTYLSGFWQNEGYFAEVAPQIRSEFSLRSCLTEETALLIEQVGKGQTVSLHVRQAGYADALPASYYLDAVAEMQRRVIDPTFYVFTDDLAWARRELKLPPRSILVDFLNRGEPWQDLLAMSRCRHHVIANSSFSWWGAWLDPRPDKVVLAPRVWFFQDHQGDAEFRLPAAWTRV